MLYSRAAFASFDGESRVPMYEYSCLKCGERIEALQAMNDDPLTNCEACGGDLKKLLSAPAFQFKGSGWYVTDYAKKNDRAESSSSETSSSDSESESKSDSSSKTDSKKDSSSSSAAAETKKKSSA